MRKWFIAVTPLFVTDIPSRARAPADFCASIFTLKQLAVSDFQPIDRGTSRPSSRSHETSLVLPGAQRCWISVGGRGRPSYWCTWKVPPQALGQQAVQFGNSIGRCIGATPEWDRDGSSISTFISSGSTEFYISAEDDEIDLSVEEDD